MKPHYFWLLAAFSLIATPAVSADAPHKPAAIQHYRVAEPNSVADALELLKQEIAATKQSVHDRKWEYVHKRSYSLEAAVERLRKESDATAAQTQALDTLDELVQIIHASSETQKGKIVQEHFPKLEQAAEEVERLYASKTSKK